MRAIFLKEMKSYFSAMTGYVFLAVFLAFSGSFFTVNNLRIQSSDMSRYFSDMLGVLMFIIPFLTMKLFSEEKKLKTYVGLKTLPVSTIQIVLGKFFSACVLFIIAACITLFYVLLILAYGNLYWPMVLGNYLAIILLSAALISIGMFISALTENQIVAAFVTFFVFYISGYIGAMPKTNVPLWTLPILDVLAIFHHHVDFTMGIFSINSAVYYVSIVAVMLALTSFMLQTRRWG